MVNKDEELEIQQLIVSFIKKMNEWEVYCNNIEGEANETKLQKDAVVKIFQEYCTTKERKFGRPTTISYGTNGSYGYDFKLEKIIKIEWGNNRKAHIHTLRKDPMTEECIYVVIKKRDQWLIDSKKRYSQWKKKWNNISL